MAQREVTSTGATLAVYEDGDPADPTVLLVHGYPDTAAVWDEVAARLRDRFHVVTYDVRGAGASTVPGSRQAYELRELAADLEAVIDAVCPGEPVHLVGHDWGSIQGWEAVTGAVAAGRIASFTSISGPCLDHVACWMRSRIGGDGRQLAQRAGVEANREAAWSPVRAEGAPKTTRRPGRIRGWARVAGQGIRSSYVGFFQLPAVPEALWRHGLADRWAALLARTEGIEPRPGHPAPTLARDAAAGLALYRANMPGRLRRPRERRTDVPVQLVVPTRDIYVSPAVYGDLDRWVPRLWRRDVRAGHWVQRSHPEMLARWVTEFVDYVRGHPAGRSLSRARTVLTRRPFQDHLVMVTGAGSGIGQATCLAFGQRGAEVIAADIDGDAARRTAELVSEHAPAYAHTVDVADRADMERFAATVRAEHGVPDVVVNNAGLAVAGSFLDTGVEEWERIVGVNLWGVVHGARLFATQMAERGEGGHVVNIASAAAYLPSRSLPAYSTTKSAVLMLSQCLRAELAGHGIGVSVICPGFVDTGISRAARFVGFSEDEQDALRDRTARAFRRRNFTPDRVADEIVRAVRDDVAFVPVNAEAKAGQLLARVSPAAVRGIARGVNLVGSRRRGTSSVTGRPR